MPSSSAVCVTGAAGFVGAHLIREMTLADIPIGWAGDSLAPSYGGDLSQVRAASLEPLQEIERVDILSLGPGPLADRFRGASVIVHLAAAPGVRAGETDPLNTLNCNVRSFQLVLESAALAGVPCVLYASSSSVYGDKGKGGPCREALATGQDMKSWYATTKWMNELQARDFTRRTGIPTTALRFFTIYGSLGRPDMAYMKFANDIVEGKPITLFGTDGGYRDFTHVSDAVHMVSRLISLIRDGQLQDPPTAMNVARGKPHSTLSMVQSLSSALGGGPVHIRRVSRPDVDAEVTAADISLSERLLRYSPRVDLDAGMAEFAGWFLTYSREKLNVEYP